MYYVALTIVIIVFIWRIVTGFRKGMVGEIVSLISMIVAAISLIVILMALRSYLDGKPGTVLQMLLIFMAISVVYKIASLIFNSLKAIAKLPIISSFNRILGAALGAVEAIVIILILLQVLRFFAFPLPISEIFPTEITAMNQPF
jgi:uncharacterized membrane protein required for colicin V production